MSHWAVETSSSCQNYVQMQPYQPFILQTLDPLLSNDV